MPPINCEPLADILPATAPDPATEISDPTDVEFLTYSELPSQAREVTDNTEVLKNEFPLKYPEIRAFDPTESPAELTAGPEKEVWEPKKVPHETLKLDLVAVVPAIERSLPKQEEPLVDSDPEIRVELSRWADPDTRKQYATDKSEPAAKLDCTDKEEPINEAPATERESQKEEAPSSCSESAP
jgi:hypothetical protein